MNWYNGYNSAERDAMTRALRRGEAPASATSPPCTMCQDPTPAIIQTHAEDYSQPFIWDPPACYPICRSCHTRLHLRFRNPDRWKTYREFVRGGWYGREVTSAALSQALRLGTVPACPDDTRMRHASADGYWWDQLTLDPASLYDPQMRRQTTAC